MRPPPKGIFLPFSVASSWGPRPFFGHFILSVDFRSKVLFQCLLDESSAGEEKESGSISFQIGGQSIRRLCPGTLKKHRPRRPRENSSFPAVADALSLCLQAKAHQALCGAETDLGEREGSWETEHLRGHMGLRLGPKYWPGGAQVFWFQG